MRLGDGINWKQLRILGALLNAEGNTLPERALAEQTDPENFDDYLADLATKHLVEFDGETVGEARIVSLTEGGRTLVQEQQQLLTEVRNEVSRSLSRFRNLVIPIPVPKLPNYSSLTMAMARLTEGFPRVAEFQTKLFSPMLAMKGYVEQQKILFQAIAEDVKRFEETDYPGKWIGSVPMTFQRNLLSLFEQQGEEAVWEALVGRARDDEFLDALAAKVGERDFVQDSAPIIEDALSAHIEQRYALSIPALMPQIEGSLRRLCHKCGKATKEEAGIGQPGTLSVYRILDKLQSRDSILFEYFVSYLKERFFKQDRNPILHGNYPNYPSPRLSAACIFAVWELCDMDQD